MYNINSKSATKFLKQRVIANKPKERKWSDKKTLNPKKVKKKNKQ